MIKAGIDVLQEANFQALEGVRVGLYTNPSAVNADMLSTYQLLVDAENVNLVALFAAEHGAFGRVSDGEHIENIVDSATGIPIRSLYGTSFKPTADMLSDIELMVCDIQDIGVRYYTYSWTMSYLIEACGECNVPVIVLDRPNPTGDTVAGCGLDADFSSLVGRFDVPIQYGMSVGELMQMVNGEWNETPAELTVIACENYSRSMTWADFQRPFVPTSPNMPQIVTVKHYPGACLIEGTTLSEGRGTTIPFEIAGAPYIDGRSLAHKLNAMNLPGVRFRPHFFTPIVRKYAGETCEGVQVHITGDDFQPILSWLTVIHTIKSMYPDKFGWREPYREGGLLPFDRLIGSDQPRQQFDNGASLSEIMQGWDNYAIEFRERRKSYLIYS